MTIEVNGEPAHVADGATVADLLAQRALGPKGIAVACNDEVVPRSAWATTRLSAGDRLEILSAAQGG